MSYPSDSRDAQRRLLARFFARPDPRGAREKHSRRRVVEACWYRLREGGRWRVLSRDFAGGSTVADPWRRWKKRGGWAAAV